MGDIERAIKRLASWGDLPEIRALLMELLEAREELAELRRLRDRPLTMFGVWAHGGDDPVPSRVCLADDGDGVDHQIDATPLLSEVLRRQAKRWCRAAEDSERPALEQLLSMIPDGVELIVTVQEESYRAGWWTAKMESGKVEPLASADGLTLVAAIRAATCELLGVDVPAGDQQLSGSPADLIRAAIDVVDDWAPDYAERTPHEEALVVAVEAIRGATAAEPRQTCGSCQHWQRDDEPATEGGARPCGLDEEPDPAPRHPASLCARPGYFRAHPCTSCDDEPDDCEHPWELFCCDTCEQQQPLCKVAADAYPETCDDCVAALPLPEAKTDPAPDSDSPPLKGVTRPAANVIRSEGDES